MLHFRPLTSRLLTRYGVLSLPPRERYSTTAPHYSPSRRPEPAAKTRNPRPKSQNGVWTWNISYGVERIDTCTLILFENWTFVTLELGFGHWTKARLLEHRLVIVGIYWALDKSQDSCPPIRISFTGSFTWFEHPKLNIPLWSYSSSYCRTLI